MKTVNFKRKNEVTNKRAARIIWKCKNLLYLYIKIENKQLKDQKHCKVGNHCHYRGEYRNAAHSICNLKYTVPKKIIVAFHNESNYDYLFTIK